MGCPGLIAASPKRLIVTGGGTGGHTYPALTAIRALETRLAAPGRGLEVLWVGTPEGLEAQVAAAEGIAFQTVATGKVLGSRFGDRLPAGAIRHADGLAGRLPP